MKDNIYGGRGKCSICGEIVSNVAYHEPVCEKETKVKATSDALINHYNFNQGNPDYKLDKQVNFSHVFKSDKDRIKDLEEENAILKNTVKELNDKVYSLQQRINRMYNDSYDDVTPDRDDR